jgi:hypothetical protein
MSFKFRWFSTDNDPTKLSSIESFIANVEANAAFFAIMSRANAQNAIIEIRDHVYTSGDTEVNAITHLHEIPPRIEFNLSRMKFGTDSNGNPTVTFGGDKKALQDVIVHEFLHTALPDLVNDKFHEAPLSTFTQLMKSDPSFTSDAIRDLVGEYYYRLIAAGWQSEIKGGTGAGDEIARYEAIAGYLQRNHPEIWDSLAHDYGTAMSDLKDPAFRAEFLRSSFAPRLPDVGGDGLVENDWYGPNGIARTDIITSDGTEVTTTYTTNPTTGETTSWTPTVTLPGKTASAPPTGLTGAQIGEVFGSSIGQALGGKNAFAKIAAGAALSTVGGTLGKTIDLYFDDAHPISFEGALATSLDGFGNALGHNLLNAGTGALSGFLMGELDRLLGIDTTTFGGQLVNVAGNTLLNKVLTNIAGGQGVFNGLDGTIVSNLPGAIGGFLGSYLAHEVLHAESAIGAIGGNIGGTLGSALATSLILGGEATAGLAGGLLTVGGLFAGVQTIADILANILVPGLGAFFGTIFGTLIGELFNRPQTNEGYVLLDLNPGEQAFTYHGAFISGPQAAAVSDTMHTFSERVAATLNDLISVTGGKVVTSSLIELRFHQSTLHHYVDFVTGTNISLFGTPIGQNQFDYAVVNELKALRIEGGDIYVKRAINATPASHQKFVPGQSVGYGENADYIPEHYETVYTTTGELVGNIKIAQDFELYLQNKSIIDALIKENPNSEFTAGWIVTLAKAEELGLNKIQASDFSGGVASFLQSYHVERFGVTLADASPRFDHTGKVFLDLAHHDGTPATSIEIPSFWSLTGMSYLGSAANTVSSAAGSKVWLAGSAANSVFTEYAASSNDVIIAAGGNDTITFQNGNYWIVTGAGDDHIFGGGGNNVISAGEGDDIVSITGGNSIIYGGDGKDVISVIHGTNKVCGGAGNDIIYGGDGRDQLFGGDGDDTVLYNANNDLANVMGGAGTDTLLVLGGAVPTSFNLAAHEFERAQVRSTNSGLTRDDIYNVSWQLAEVDIYNADGTHSETLFDPTNAQPWQQQVTLFNSAIQKIQQSTVNDNGTSTNQSWDPANAYNWSTVVTSYDTGGHTVQQVITYDNSSISKQIWDIANAYNWSSVTTSYDANARTTQQSVAYDNGTSSTQNWDPANAYNWSSVLTSYDASGRVTQQSINYDAGTSSTQSWDTINAYAWSTVSTQYDSASRTTQQAVVYDNGSSTAQSWDAANAYNWSSVITSYDAGGRTTQQSISYDNGTSSAQTWDAANVFAWSTVFDTFDAAGHKLQETIFNDNGARTIQAWDTTNAHNWATLTQYFDAAGALTVTKGVYDTGGLFSF